MKMITTLYEDSKHAWLVSSGIDDNGSFKKRMESKKITYATTLNRTLVKFAGGQLTQ